jgi:hypothetical protein
LNTKFTMAFAQSSSTLLNAHPPSATSSHTHTRTQVLLSSTPSFFYFSFSTWEEIPLIISSHFIPHSFAAHPLLSLHRQPPVSHLRCWVRDIALLKGRAEGGQCMGGGRLPGANSTHVAVSRGRRALWDWRARRACIDIAEWVGWSSGARIQAGLPLPRPPLAPRNV